MRVLFVTQTPEYGGTERHVVELVRRLANVAQCTIVCLAEDFYTQHLGQVAGVRIVKYPRIWSWRLLRFWWVIIRYWAPIVVFQKGVPDQFPISAYGAARLAGVPRIVCVEHLMWPPAPPAVPAKGLLGTLKSYVGWRRRFLLEKWLQGRLVHQTICVSHAIRNRLLTEYGYPQDRTDVVHNGADLRHYTRRADNLRGAEAGGRDSPVRLLCVARLSPVKRIDLLLEALAILAQSHQGWVCTVVGGGPLAQELHEQAIRLGLADKVRFTGHVSDTKAYVMQADLCILPSDQEGLPLSLAEAMAVGVPCIATDVGGTREIVLHGKTGLLVTPGATEELVAAIQHLVLHAEERRQMGEAAHEWAHQHFDIEQQLAEFKAVLMESPDRRPSGKTVGVS